MPEYDPWTGLPDVGFSDPADVADLLYNPRMRPGRISQRGNVLPPRPYSPMLEEPDSAYKRALNAVGKVGQVLGTTYRAAGTGVAMARGLAEGDPLKYMSLAPGQMQGDLLEDIGGVVGATAPAFHTPDPIETVKSAAMASGALASETLGGSPEFYGEELGLGQDGLPLKELTPAQRQEWEEKNPIKAYTKAVAGPVTDLVLPFGLDPMMAVLGSAGAPGRLGMLGRAALPVAKAVAPAFIPAMAAGAAHNLTSAYQRAQAEGLTPQVVREATTGVAEGLMAAAGAAHVGGKLYGRFRGEPAVVHEGEVVPGQEPGTALGFPRREAGPVMEGEVLSRETVQSPIEDAIARRLQAGQAQLGPGEAPAPGPEAMPPEVPQEIYREDLPPTLPEEAPLPARAPAPDRATMDALIDQRLEKLRQQMGYSVIDKAEAQARPVPAAEPAERRDIERRTEAVPVEADRRAAERRARLATELELPEEHPAVTRAADLEAQVEEAETDPLMGIPTRRVYERDLPAHKGHVVAMDVSGLKWVNDTYGHQVGDSFLGTAGEAVREEAGVRGYRTGGDEITLLADTPETAHAAAASIQRRFAEAEFSGQSGGRTVTLRGGRIDYGVGEGVESAEQDLLSSRAAALASGARSERGTRPAGLSEVPGPGQPDQDQAAAQEVAQQPTEAVPPSETKEEAAAVPPRAPGPGGADVPPIAVSVGDRVSADEGVGEVARARGDAVRIALDPGGKLSNWIPRSRVQHERPRPAESVVEREPTPARPLAVRTAEDVAVAAERVEPAPSPAQKEAGNYSKGHIRWKGMDIAIETAKGGERVAKDGSWRVGEMPAHYGYLKKTEGNDGDQVDVYVGDDLDSDRVFVIDQIHPGTKRFDEHKVMLGFPSARAALGAYKAAFNDGSGVSRIGAATEMSSQQFRAWLANGDTKKPVAYEAPPTPFASPAPAPAPAKPVTPQIPSEPGTKYVLPSFATGIPRGMPVAAPAGAPLQTLVEALGKELAGGGAIDNRRLTALAEEAFGGTRGQGKFSPRDAYDALEAAVNQVIAERAPALLAMPPAEALAELRALMKRLPTQTDRTVEQVELQQFSTPPTQAFVAAQALGVHPGEVVLEPSAGVGGLAVWARAAGGDVRVNEVAPRRVELLRGLGFTPTTVDAEHLNDLLPDEIQPTAILMNPPFSATGGRVKAHKTSFGARHVEQALERLAPGGRLVAIVGQGMAFEGATPRGKGRQATGSAFRDWWLRTMAKYNVRANIGIPGGEYGKYGTTFGNQILVIDKAGPTPGASPAEQLRGVVRGSMVSLEDALATLRPIAADRSEAGPDVAPQPAGQVEPRGAGVLRAPGEGEARGGGGGVRPGPVGAGVPGGRTAEEPAPVREVEPGPGRAAGEGQLPASAGGPPDVVPGQPTVEAPAAPAATVERETEAGGTFVRYAPPKLSRKGLKPHPAKIVEAASMAAVEPPDITYRAAIPQSVLDEGRLSDLQYEVVLYAGQRHSQTLPDGSRAGHFIGDGTGVGKGREIAGVVFDNWSHGRRRSLWVSVSRDLQEAARADLNDVAGKDTIPIASINDYAMGGKIDLKEGVVFTTYSSLISKGKEAGTSRLKQLTDWLGDEGLLVFDEAHKAKNALAAGRAEPTQTGQAVIQIQAGLPGARVLYVSATGATDTRNMAYMTRLGLWAPEIPPVELGSSTEHQLELANARERIREASGRYAFPGGFNEFLVEVEGGGVGAKEMVSRDLKALGMYNSRSISFEGVEYRESIHPLTPEQRGMYDGAARAWQVILQNIDAAIGITGGGKNQRTAAIKRFWGDHQRFFRQLTTALKMPTVIREVEDALRAGESAIVTLKGTAEGKVAEQVSAANAEGKSLDDLDFTPRETIAQMVTNAFPTQLYEEVTHPTDPTKTIRQAVVRDGKPVQSKEAVAIRQSVLDGLSDLVLPDNPLDQFVNHFGAKNVAEMTGRKKRLIRDPKTGKTTYEKRAGDGVAANKVNLNEMRSFQGGKKRIAIISRAASTGISLHASLREKNQQRRRQIAAELDWSADAEMQTFGRSHRSDQASAPIYVLVSTDVGGEKRFSSTIARRLASLGALTKGQRDATGGGELAKYNFETREGEVALSNLYDRMQRPGNKPIEGLEDPHQTLKDMGILKKLEGGGTGIDAKDMADVPRFLNRLLALDVRRQNAVFEEFTNQFETAIASAKAVGQFDEGVADLKGTEIRVKGEPTLIHKDQVTGAETRHFVLEVDKPTKPVPWKRILNVQDAAQERGTQMAGFYRNERSGRVVYAEVGGKRTDQRTGETYETMAVSTPRAIRAEIGKRADFEDGDKWGPVPSTVAQSAWEEVLRGIPKVETEQHNIIAGAILPLWAKLKAGESDKIRIVRAVAKDGRRVVGVEIPKAEVGRVMQALGVGRTFESPEDVFRAAWEQGETVALEEGLTVRKSRVHGEDRLELGGVKSQRFGQVRAIPGMIEETIDYRNRFFVPSEADAGVPVLREVLKAYPPLGPPAAAAGAGGAAPPPEPPRAGAAPAAEEPPARGGLGGAADAARARLRARGRGKANDLGSAAAEGAGTLKDLGVIGADLLSRGLRRFGVWARRMMADLGDVVKGLARALRRIWQDAQQVLRGRERAPRAAEAPRARKAASAERPKTGPPKPGESLEDFLRRTASVASERASKVRETFEAMNKKFEQARRHAETVREKGTIPKEERESFRRGGQPAREATRGFRFSEADIEQAGAELVDAVRQFEAAKRAFERSADPASAKNMRTAETVMRDAVKGWQVYRSAAGRAVHRFSEPIPENVIERLREAGVNADFARLAKERVPIASNIVESLRRWKDLTSAEKTQLGKDLLDHFRLNLFSVTSWTLDIIGNASELAAQAAGGVASDLVHMVKGSPTFPSMQGLLRAMRYRARHPFEPIGGGIDELLEHTIGGERIGTEASGRGRWFVPRQSIFTRRGNLASTIYDYMVGGPLYLKGAMDTAAKRLGATWQVFKEAIEEADRQGLNGADRQRFVDDFVEDIPEATAKRAAERAKKAGFDRELSSLEERMAGSPVAKLLVDAFARWPFQFTRWAGEMLGYNRELFGKMARGKATAEEIASYLGKAATGWGGLIMLNQIYNRVDFNSMEYVDDDGNRIRLSNRDPIPSAMWFLALLHGDKDKAIAGLQFASVPFGRLLSAEGGLLGGTVVKFQEAAKNPQNAPRALRREMEDLLNRAIPGQALLSAVETVFDPTIREGVGANLPLVSSMLPAAVDPTTGEDLSPRQRVLGFEIPSIGGTPIPGATRLLTPVHKLLSRYGLLVYRGPRQPVAGYPAGQMPEELQDEWTRLFGYYRNRLLGPMGDQLDRLEGLDDERVRKEIQRRDSAAARYATLHLSRQAGITMKPGRQPTVRERRGPAVWMP